MASFVLVKDVARAMSPFAPPAWCKLALMGALATSRTRLWAGVGYFRAYLPPYSLWDERAEALPLVRTLRRGESPADLIARYDLTVTELPNTADVEVWKEEWTEPLYIALGWHSFAEPWDWDEPKLLYEGFEVPRDYEMLFGYDDLHPEGEPDLGLTYQASFERLCIEMTDAEQLAPMVDWEAHAFGSKSNSPMRSIGRPKGTGFQSADEPIVKQMLADWRADNSLTALSLAKKYADQAAGHGTRDSIVKRLQRRLSGFGI